MVLRGRPRRTAWTLALTLGAPCLSAGCASQHRDAERSAPAARALLTAGTVHVPAGTFLMGSTLDERATALELAYAGHGRVFPDATTWLKQEYRQGPVELGEYWIMEHPVTQSAYLDYVRAVGAPEPFVDLATWQRQQLGSPYARVERVRWRGGRPQVGREAHPVVLVSQPQAEAYCAWWGQARGGVGHLPTEAQWEKAARGEDGRAYPWGAHYDPALLNAADAGPGDTVAAGAFEAGASPYGALDMAGNVFEWTRSPHPDFARQPSFVVKGGAYTTYGHAARAAARHYRPPELRHTIIGFRCVLAPRPAKRRRGDRNPKRDAN